MIFLTFLFLIGLIIASLQDLKRREVDNWLNILLIFSSFAFIFLKAVFNWDYSIVIYAGFSLMLLFIISNLFYYGRVFAGGDAKLLFAMSAFFIGASCIETAKNIGVFIVLLLISGGLWGLAYSLFLFFNKFEKTGKEFLKIFNNSSLKIIFFLGIFCLPLIFLDILFLVPVLLLILWPILFCFAKSVENIGMIKETETKKLVEGDWIIDNIKVNGKVIKPNWEGLNSSEIKLLKKYKRKIKVKDGIPFVPGFLIAFLFYLFRFGILNLFH
ncbi:MAG: prepilin peptidase [Nanoarchaeota archaeon]